MNLDVRNGVVYLGEGELEDPIELTPAEAAALGGRLGQAAHLGWQQRSAIEAACEGGHDWGAHLNGHLAGQHVTQRYCRREGCHEVMNLQGWMPFAGRLHLAPWGDVLDCWGLGCEWCDAAKLGEAFRAALAEGLSAMDRAALGVPSAAVESPTG